MSTETKTGKLRKTEAEWRDLLTPEQFHIMREKGTERAFSGPFLDNHDDGIYHCAACNAPLFKSDSKFESGSGWPSFSSLSPRMRSRRMKTTPTGCAAVEVTCATCGAHLGHVFPDGPRPSGQRFCINGAALGFSKEEQGREDKPA